MLPQACRLHPQLKALCAVPGITPEYLLKRVKKVDPGLACGRVPTKPAFTAQQKAAWLEHCRKFLDCSPPLWYQVAGVDEFSVYEKTDPHTTLHRKGDKSMAADSRLMHFSWDSYDKLPLCIVINAYAGLVRYWSDSQHNGLQWQDRFQGECGQGGWASP